MSAKLKRDQNVTFVKNTNETITFIILEEFYKENLISCCILFRITFVVY